MERTNRYTYTADIVILMLAMATHFYKLYQFIIIRGFYHLPPSPPPCARVPAQNAAFLRTPALGSTRLVLISGSTWLMYFAEALNIVSNDQKDTKKRS